MAKYRKTQAQKIARQIFDRFGHMIEWACANSSVTQDFLCGFIAVEAGKHSDGRINPDATRFEPGVYRHLIALREGNQKTYNKITHNQVKDLTDAAIRNLATSFNLTQIMGWHCINDLKCTVAELRNTPTHLDYAVKLLEIVASLYLKRKNFEAVLRIWNSGSPTGATYDPDYIYNALAVKSEYAAILKNSISTDAHQPRELVPTNSTGKPATSADVEMGAADAEGQPDQSLDAGTSAPPPNTNQTAENITNVNNGDKIVPDGFTPEEKTMDAPAASGVSTGLNKWAAYLGLGVPSIAGIGQGIKGLYSDGTIAPADIFAAISSVFKYVLPYSVYIILGLVAYKIAKEVLKQISFIVRMWLNARSDTHNIHIATVEPGAKAVEAKPPLFERIFGVK